MKYFQTDKDGVFLYESPYDVKSNRSVEVAPPSGPGTKVWESSVPVTDLNFGTKETGKWEIKEDNRKEKLYSQDGEYTIGSDLNGDSYNGLGDVPKWLSKEERPSQFHNLIDGVWEEDEEAALDQKKIEARSWRDSSISKVEWLRNRHNDEVAFGIPTTLTEEEFSEILAYIQALRDYPQQDDFPSESIRPEKPSWVP